jgi:hypothetical protein
MGRKRGVKRPTLEVVSMNIPVMRRKPMRAHEDDGIVREGEHGLRQGRGMRSMVRSRPKVVAPPRMNRERQESTPASTQASKSFGKSRRR